MTAAEAVVWVVGILTLGWIVVIAITQVARVRVTKHEGQDPQRRRREERRRESA